MKRMKRALALLLSLALMLGLFGLAEEPVEAAEVEELIEEVVEEVPVEPVEELPEEAVEEPEAEEAPAGEEPAEEPAEELPADDISAEVESFDAYDENGFNIEGGELKGYRGSAVNLVIPDGVTSIGHGALWGNSIESVYIPDSVTTIGEMAFRDCESLTSVHIGSGVKVIGNDAFTECDALTSIDIPGNVEELSFGAFSLARGLANVTLHEGLKRIGESVFYGCNALKTISIPDSVTEIGSRTFGASKLVSLHLGAGLTSISDELCYDSRFLESVNIPDGVKSIGEKAFGECNPLNGIDIPGSVETIGDQAFYNCSGLGYIKFGDGVKSIGASAFENAGNSDATNVHVTNIEIPDSVTFIGERAFANCGRLQIVKLPNGLTSIGNEVFDGCPNLQSINLPSTLTSIGDRAFRGYSNSKIVFVVPEGVTSIGAEAFNAQHDFCKNKIVYLPKSLTTIGADAFMKTTQATVYVYKDSYAEQYCKENGILYEYRDGKEPDLPVSDGRITLSFTSRTMVAGQSVTLKASTPDLGKTEKYSFKTSDAKIASVSATSGKIKAKKTGTVTITVTGKTSKSSAICAISVLPAPIVMSLNKTKETRNIGETVRLSVIINPPSAPQNVTWSIPKKQKKYASVDEKGVVTALAEGKVTVTATSVYKTIHGKSLTKKFTLTVVDPTKPTGIHIDPETPSELVMTNGEQVPLQLKHGLEPEGTAESEVTWSIPKKAHKKIASITPQGLLTPKKAGSVSVKVTAKKKSPSGKTVSATFKITIVDPTIPTSVTIAEADGTPITQTKQIKKGEKLTLRATCAPETAASAELEWSSSNTKVAKVNKTTGEITAVKPGKAKITAKAKKGGKKASVTVQVIK